MKSNYIYEFDLKEFFDRINLDYLHNYLLSTGIPKEIADQLIGWSRISPRKEKDSIKHAITYARSEELWNEKCKS